MKPVLIELGHLEVTSYGVSKALAALVGGWLLTRELRRVGRDPELAWALTIAAALGGFAGAKLYYLAERGSEISLHDLGGMGFTWYGGLLGGAAAVLLVARLRGIPASLMAGISAVPLAVAYGIGRIGCLLAGDGTYGIASDLPWAMSFPEGTVPTTEQVHPTPLYEALAAFAIAALLWRLRTRLSPLALFALFAVLMGASRFLVEFVRRQEEIVAGLTAPQLWSAAFVAVGAVIAFRLSGGRLQPGPSGAPGGR
ncbi:MAG: prolipoprotein diacylglyceryl transferase [Acidimicrobiia bacterium]